MKPTVSPQDRDSLLLIATRYHWIRPYADSVIRDLWDDRCRLVILLGSESDRAHFSHLPADRVHFVTVPKGVIATKRFLLRPRKLEKLVWELVRRHQPRAVLSLTIDHPLSHLLEKLQKKVPTVYVAHNSHVHQYTHSSLWKKFYYDHWIARPLKRLLDTTTHKIVNARWQRDRILREHPGQKVAYLPFPSLVTPEIAGGHDTVPELRGQSGYILFFGLVERYKGVERLLEIFAGTPELAGRQLVIAGKGRLLYPIQPSLRNRVTRLNRHIPDSQVAELFRNAAVVVYPYLAATQSGVVSIASYFGRPTVVSDVAFFREVCQGQPGVRIADVNNSQQFGRAIADSIKDPVSSRPLYDDIYASFSWRKELDRQLDEWFPA